MAEGKNFDYGAIDPIVGGIGLLYNMGSGIAQQVMNAKNDDWNKKFAREQFDYQKSLNDRLMEREDNAVQRRAADLEAAGLSKTLAAGDAAQSSVAGISPLGNAANSNKTFQQLQRMDIANSYAQYKMTRANEITRLKEGNLIDAEADTQIALQNMYNAQADNYNSITNMNEHNLRYARFFKMPTGLSARASNKYELLSSFGQFLLQTVFEPGGAHKSFEQASKQYSEFLDSENITGSDKQKLMNDFYKAHGAIKGQKDINGDWIY